MNKIMNEFRRDPSTGALIFSDPEKRREILEKRNLLREIKVMREELNTLKKIVEQLVAKSN